MLGIFLCLALILIFLGGVILIVETMIISIIIGKMRKGKIDNIGYLNINKWYIFFIAFAIKIISILVVTRTEGSVSNFLDINFSYIHIFIYLLFLIALFLNISEKGFKFVFAGSLLNFIPMVFNKGKMPISINALKFSKLYTQLALLDEGRIMTHSLIEKGTKFWILADIIPIPKPYLFPKIISIGDILLAIGLYMIILKYMKDPENNILKIK